MESKVRKYRLEIILAIAIVALVLPPGIPPLGALYNKPSPGSIGVDHLDEIEGIYGFSNECLVYLPCVRPFFQLPVASISSWHR
jgi:hypothetical protein